AAAIGDGEPPASEIPFVRAMARAVDDASLDPALLALALALPSEDELASEMSMRGIDGARRPADPDAIHAGRRSVRLALAETLQAPLNRIYASMETPGPYSPDAASAGKRALKNAALSLLSALPGAAALAARQFEAADNMSDQMPALTALVHEGAPEADAALDQFYERWRNDALVLGKWFGVQAMSPQPDALERVAMLTEHAAFEWTNPNKFRALIGAFGMANAVNFHRKDGSGYRFYADWLMRLDPVNPQTAAKLIGAFETKARYDADRQGLMEAELERIAAKPDLSKDSAEMVKRLLDA
ncbi:MAG: aminopeptidase N C-terminal domain-containing protein, partial [Pseudomonadota bacterium]